MVITAAEGHALPVCTRAWLTTGQRPALHIQPQALQAKNALVSKETLKDSAKTSWLNVSQKACLHTQEKSCGVGLGGVEWGGKTSYTQFKETAQRQSTGNVRRKHFTAT